MVNGKVASVVLGMFKDSTIMLDVIRWSFLTNSASAAMFELKSILDGHLSHHLLPAPFCLKIENTTKNF